MVSTPVAKSRDVGASQRAEIGLRSLLLKAAVEDFVAQSIHEPQELTRFTELVGHLINGAEEADLSAVVDALCRRPDAPPEILQRIYQRGGAPARKILRRDTRLTAEALEQIAQDHACGDAAAIAGRRDLSAPAVAALAIRPEREILRRLAANPALSFTPAQWRMLVIRGRDDATLASALLGRDDGPSLHMLPLFLHATTAQRACLLARALEQDCAAGGPDDYARARAVTPKILRARRAGALALALSRALGADFFRTRRLVADPSGEALILALRAVGLDAVEIEKIIAEAAPRLTLRENFSAALALAGAAPRRVALRMTAAMLDLPSGASRPDDLGASQLRDPAKAQRKA